MGNDKEKGCEDSENRNKKNKVIFIIQEDTCVYVHP